MKTLISLAVLLAVVGVAQAELDHDGIKRHNIQQHQHLSKRPYAAPVADKEKFEGAVVDKEVVEQPKKIRAFMLDRRPYMEKAAD
jgi:hypothetical protein